MAENLANLATTITTLNTNIVALLLEIRRLRLALSVITDIDLADLTTAEVE